MPETDNRIYSVSEITTGIKNLLEMHFKNVKVTGEISNFRPASSGHWYFQLKDRDATVSIVMFKSRAFRVPFTPKDGDKVIISGSMSVYAPRGGYQIIAETMSLSGTGDILAMLEQRKRHYESLGYFDSSRKKEIPRFPRKVGIITSDTGAAIRDILHVLNRRNKSVNLVIFPTLVQGDRAGEMIAKRIGQAQRTTDLDVLIVTRGGGSLEDLLPFSEEQVIEALYTCSIPTISAVGHEIDNALSDYVADRRAPTPSAAAEIVSVSYEEIYSAVRSYREEMSRIISHTIALAKSELKQYDITTMHEGVARRIKDIRLLTDDLHTRQIQHIETKMTSVKRDLLLYKETLDALSPFHVLERGYSIVTDRKEGKTITSSAFLSKGEDVSIVFKKGSADAQITNITRPQKET